MDITPSNEKKFNEIYSSVSEMNDVTMLEDEYSIARHDLCTSEMAAERTQEKIDEIGDAPGYMFFDLEDDENRVEFLEDRLHVILVRLREVAPHLPPFSK